MHARFCRVVTILAALFMLTGGLAAAQSQPFVFTVTTLRPPSPNEKWLVRYEAGYGEHTSEPFAFASFQLGVEAVGEDLEGLWETDEAEGGAKIFLGPSVHVAPPHTSWSGSLSGGPVLYATRSARTSPAVRPLQATDNGYTVRVSFGYSF